MGRAARPTVPDRFRDVSILTPCYRTEPGGDRSAPPPSARALGDIVLVHIYLMPDIDFLGKAHECNVMVGAALDDGGEPSEGGYSTALYLDSDVGIAHGREVHGQPKKLAASQLETRGDLIVGEVVRNEITISPARSRTSSGRGSRRAAPPLRLHGEHQLQGHPPHRRHSGDTPAHRATAHELTIHECWTGPCTVELRPNAQAPVWMLPVVEPLEGFFWKADFTLVAGRVLHDYLAAGG